MRQEETSHICDKCGARNAVDVLYCQDCGGVLEAKSTRLLPETQPAPKVVPMRRPRQSPFPRFPSLSPIVQRTSERVKREKRWILLISTLMIIIILLSIFVPQIINYLRGGSSTISPDGIGITTVDGEDIGISDGRYAFHINPHTESLMKEASESLRNGNLGNALSEWKAAHEQDTSDAEPLIYAEDQRVLASGSPYITVVLGLSLGVKIGDRFSPDVLQGAYIAQKECNENPQLSGGKRLRLLIARSGSNPDRSKDIAKQIVQAARFDKTIVGVVGWTNSVTTLNALKILVDAHLPMLASEAASDELTGISPYFFRVGVSNMVKSPLITDYIEKKLASQRVVIFRDHTEPSSLSLSDGFAYKFRNDGYPIASIEDFKTAEDTQNGKLTQHVQKVLTIYKPDLIFVATNNVNDIKTIINTIPATAEYADLKVFSSSVAYELAEEEKKPDGYARLLISVSAFPDEWKILGPGNQEPPFFKDYIAAYDPHDQHIDHHPYTYRRATAKVMLAYDALYVFLVGNKIAIQQGKQDPTLEDIRNALSQIHEMQSFQGITGVISFDSHNNPINKLRFILRVADGQFLHVAAYQGCFLVNSDECDGSIHILE